MEIRYKDITAGSISDGMFVLPHFPITRLFEASRFDDLMS